ncbi:hypothetical protein ACET3Z_008790 [Daucus carota]
MSEDHSNMTKDSEKKKKTEFEKLVEVCQMALHLFKQTEFQQAMKQNNMTSSLRCSVPDQNICSASLIKFKPPGMDRDDKKVFVDRKGKRKLRCYYDEEEEEDSDCPEKRRLCKNIMAKNKSVQVASLPLKFKNRIREMGGDDVKLIIQKHMFAADVAQGQNRFSIPINQVREDAKEFLTEEEISRVPMELPFIEPNLDLTRIVIRKWNYSAVVFSSSRGFESGAGGSLER